MQLREKPTPQILFLFLAGISFLLLSSAAVLGQQPFYTDDADVTPRHHFHFEFSNEYDLLQRSSYPSLRQNTADFELDFGLFENVEVGIEAPLITIMNTQGTLPQTPMGIGDTNLSVKWNFHKEQEHSRMPALALAFDFEMPTGNVSNQLGSGLADYTVYGIAQKSVSSKTKLRLNGGILFSGNTTTGVIGIKTRGLVLIGGASLVRQFTRKLDLGFEFTGALTKNLDLSKGQLQFLGGGNYQLTKKMSLDFGILGGKFAASPRIGAQLGISVDF